MKLSLPYLAIALLCAIQYQATAQTLSVGDDAPTLEVSRWLKGEKIERFANDRVYMIIFWTTSSEMSKFTIPRISKFHESYKSKEVTFIGINIYEQDVRESLAFANEKDAEITYSMALDLVPVGIDPRNGKMAKNWMDAAGWQQIPAAFLIKNGKIAWIGHPLASEKEIKLALEPTYDFAKAAQSFRDDRIRQQMEPIFIEKARQLGNRKATQKEYLQLITETIEQTPELELNLGLLKYQYSITAEDKGAPACGMKLLTGIYEDDPDMLNTFASYIINPSSELTEDKRDYELGLKVAIRANQLAGKKNWRNLENLALAYFKTGDPARAVRFQQDAIELFGGGDEEKFKQLDRYRQAAIRRNR